MSDDSSGAVRALRRSHDLLTQTVTPLDAAGIRWTIAFLFAGVFFLALPMGISAAALQRIFPNQVRGVVSALYLFILNIGGLSLGPLLPGLFNDYLFHNGKMIGYSLSITMGGAAVLMLITLVAAYRHYRIHYQMMVATTVPA